MAASLMESHFYSLDKEVKQIIVAREIAFGAREIEFGANRTIRLAGPAS